MFWHVATPRQTGPATPFNHYLTGLGYLSKTDVHRQFEPHAFAEMYKAMKLGMSQYGDWPPPGKPYREAFEAILEKTMSGLPDYKTLVKFCEVGEDWRNTSCYPRRLISVMSE